MILIIQTVPIFCYSDLKWFMFIPITGYRYFYETKKLRILDWYAFINLLDILISKTIIFLLKKIILIKMLYALNYLFYQGLISY